jgi:hypothetical protein
MGNLMGHGLADEVVCMPTADVEIEAQFRLSSLLPDCLSRGLTAQVEAQPGSELRGGGPSTQSGCGGKQLVDARGNPFHQCPVDR